MKFVKKTTSALLLGLLFVFCLSGCDFSVELDLKVSEIVSQKDKVLPGILLAQITSCTSNEDSTKPSSSLREIVDQIDGIFPDAKYDKCSIKGFSTFAHFTIPVFVYHEIKANANEENFIIRLGNDNNVMLGIVAPNKLKNRIARAKENSTTLNISFTLNIENDTSKRYPFGVIGSYINGDPYLFERGLSLPPRSTIAVKLSDVSIDEVTSGSFTPVLLQSSQ